MPTVEKKAILISIQGKVIQSVARINEITKISNEKLSDNQIIKRFCQNKQLPNNYFFTANNAMKDFTYSEN